MYEECIQFLHIISNTYYCLLVLVILECSFLIFKFFFSILRALNIPFKNNLFHKYIIYLILLINIF